MIYGYARVSTDGQVKGTSLDDQEKALRDAGAVIIYRDHYTGISMSRPEFESMLANLKAGDTVVVTKLDRIARTANNGYDTVQKLLKDDTNVHILNMGMLDSTPTGKQMQHMMFAFAEFERDMIYDRTQSGREYKRKHDPNYREGRYSLSSEIIEKIQAGVSWQELHISRSTWYKYRKRH